MGAERSEPDIIGRDAELSTLASFVHDADQGFAMLVLAGEPGIGKTRLWHAAVDVAQRAGCTVLACRPNEAEASLPYAGIDDLLRGVAEEVFDRLSPPLRRAVDVVLLRAEADGPPLQQRAVSTAVREVLTSLAHAAPVVVAIDDVQWLDVPTAHVLQFVLRRLDREAIRVLATQRTGELAAEAFPLQGGFDEDRVMHLHIGPVDVATLGAVVQRRLDVELPRSTLRLLHERVGGNPLFGLEIARALVRSGSQTVVGDVLPVPTSLRELLSERLFRLPGPVRDALFVVSALSRPTVAVVRAALEPTSRVDVAVDRAVRAGIIEVEPDRIRFTHPLLGSVLYADTPFGQRQLVHRRLATIVADPEEQARHLALAAEGPDSEVASALDAAARSARARGAPDAAASLAEQALRFTPAGCTLHPRALEAADCNLEAGDTARARRLLEELVSTSAPGVERARALLALSRVRTYDAGFGAATPMLERALEEAAGDDDLRVSIERDLATAIVQNGDVRAAIPHARAALDAATRRGIGRLLATTLAEVAMVEFLAGNGIRADLMGQALKIEESLSPIPDSGSGFLPTNLIWGGIAKWTDDFASARRRFDAVRKRAQRFGEESTWGSLLFQHGELELWAGNWDVAARCAAEIASITVRSGQPAMRNHALYLDAAVRAHRGDLDEGRARANAALDESESSGDLRFVIRSLALLGFMEHSAGEPERALLHLEQAAKRYEASGYGEPGIIRFQPDHIEALMAVGDVEHAAACADDFEARATALRRPWAQAAAARCRGLLHAAGGALPEARVALEESVARFEQLEQPFELGRSLVALGMAQRRLKQKRAAKEALDRAVAIFEEVGAALWFTKARGELKRISGRAGGTQLTATEAAVADLVAEGRTNREVADAVFLSVKTVETNLTHIYQKLGVRSRRELARVWRERPARGAP